MPVSVCEWLPHIPFVRLAHGSTDYDLVLDPTFLDFQKAFNTVSHTLIFYCRLLCFFFLILSIINAVKSFYVRGTRFVKLISGATTKFPIHRGKLGLPYFHLSFPASYSDFTFQLE